MASVSVRIEQWEAQLFTGRKAELERMREVMQLKEWRMLQISGLSGLGKTQLLRQFCRMQPEVKCWHLELEGKAGNKDIALTEEQVRIRCASDGFPETPEDQIVPLAELPEQIAKLSSGGGRLALLFDDFEKWGPLHEWLKDRLFSQLPNHVRVITASLFPPGEAWTKDGRWNRLVEKLALQPFDQAESFRYIEQSGIKHFETQYDLAKFARGFPYALHQLCQDTLRHGAEYTASPYYQRAFYDSMTSYLLDGMALGDLELQMLDAASLLWNFDMDAIAHLIQQEVPISAFRSFCRLPLIEPAIVGWRIVPFAKLWFRKEFANRSPKHYAEMRGRTKAFVLERIRQASESEHPMWFENLLHLFENDSLHTYCFLDSSDLFVFRQLPEEDLDKARDMFISFHQQVPAFFQDLSHQEKYLEEYHRITPETFYGFYRNGQLAMFMSVLPLVPEVRECLRHNPVYRAYIEQGDHKKHDTLMWIASFLPEYSLSAIGRVFLHGFSQMAGKGRMIVLSPFPEAHHLNESLGFERLEWADYIAENGLPYKAYRLDLRDTSALESGIDKGLAGIQPIIEIRLTPEESFSLVKRILTDYEIFEQRADITAHCPYLSKFAYSSPELAEAATTVREFIGDTLAEWSASEGAYSIYSEILQACYLQKLGTHEKIAARLNMSISNYYRNLKKAIQHLSEAYRIRFNP